MSKKEKSVEEWKEWCIDCILTRGECIADCNELNPRIYELGKEVESKEVLIKFNEEMQNYIDEKYYKKKRISKEERDKMIDLLRQNPELMKPDE